MIAKIRGYTGWEHKIIFLKDHSFSFRKSVFLLNLKIILGLRVCNAYWWFLMKWVKILILSIDKAYVFDFDYTFQYKYKYVAVTFQAYVVDFDYTFQYKYKSLFITSCRSMFITSLRQSDGLKKKKKNNKGKKTNPTSRETRRVTSPQEK